MSMLVSGSVFSYSYFLRVRFSFLNLFTRSPAVPRTTRVSFAIFRILDGEASNAAGYALRLRWLAVHALHKHRRGTRC
jgi:hypothetical protein